MELFNYVMVLVSIIIGLAITHLLKGVARVVQHPGRDKIYWIHLVWVGNAFLGAVFFWWWEFRLAEQAWTFQLYLFVLFYAVLIYLRSAILFPLDLEGYDGFRDYYYSRRGWGFGLAALQVAVDVIDTLLKGMAYFTSLSVGYPIASAVLFLLFVIAAITRNERFHGAFGISLLLYQLYIAQSLYSQLS